MHPAGLDLIDPDDVDLDALIRRYLPDRVARPSAVERVGLHLIATVTVWWIVTVLLFTVGSGLPEGDAYTWLLAALALGTGGVLEVQLRRNHRRRLSKLEDDIRSGAILGEITAGFRGEIETYRRRMLGPASEWARARHPLAEARDEADRSVAYWTERVGEGGEVHMAESQLEVAHQLREKFDAAVSEIDGRAEALRSFFNRCEARLALFESRSRDREESERLARLSERADVRIEEAEAALNRIGEEFLDDAVRVGTALAGLRRLRLLDEAGRLDLSRLEEVAERVVEASNIDRRALHDLERDLRGNAGTPRSGRTSD